MSQESLFFFTKIKYIKKYILFYHLYSIYHLTEIVVCPGALKELYHIIQFVHVQWIVKLIISTLTQLGMNNNKGSSANPHVYGRHVRTFVLLVNVLGSQLLLFLRLPPPPFF